MSAKRKWTRRRKTYRDDVDAVCQSMLDDAGCGRLSKLQMENRLSYHLFRTLQAGEAFDQLAKAEVNRFLTNKRNDGEVEFPSRNEVVFVDHLVDAQIDNINERRLARVLGELATRIKFNGIHGRIIERDSAVRMALTVLREQGCDVGSDVVLDYVQNDKPLFRLLCAA